MVFDLSFKQKRRSAPSNSSTPVERYLRRSYLPKKGNSRLEHPRFPSLVLCPLHPIWSTPSRPNFFNIHPPYSQNAYTAPHYPQFQTFRDIKPHSLSRRQTIEKRPFPTATRDFWKLQSHDGSVIKERLKHSSICISLSQINIQAVLRIKSSKKIFQEIWQ